MMCAKFLWMILLTVLIIVKFEIKIQFLFLNGKIFFRNFSYQA